jgi:hypothetical protein
MIANFWCLLCNAYRPEWTDSEYWTRLSHAIGMGYQVNDNILILGDSNSDLFIELDHSNTLLDHIIVSDTINYIYCNVLKEPSEISNHDASEAFLRVLLVHLSGKSGLVFTVRPFRSISVTQKQGLTSNSNVYPDSFVNVVF